MLSQAQVVSYLTDLGPLSSEHVAGIEPSVVDLSRRNRSFCVTTSEGSSFLVKQGAGARTSSSLSTEAAVYEHLWRADPAGAAAFLPRLLSYDRERDILVTEFVARSQNLTRYHRRLGRFPVEMGRQIGHALSWLHRQRLPAGAEPALPEHPPWVLGIHRPSLASLREVSGANLRLIEIIQSESELGEALDRLRDDWRGASIVHNDVKWDNMVVVPPDRRSPDRRSPRPRSSDRRSSGRLRLLDWELATRGDPSWDVGAALTAYLETWLLSIPVVPDDPPGDLGALARYPLQAIWPAVRALWSCYAAEAGLGWLEAHRFLLRAVRACAARLLQTAYEGSQLSGTLSGGAVLFVQVSVNMLRSPAEAATSLLGLP